MKHPIKELDLVELTEDMTSGLVEGARGVVVGIRTDVCTVEYLDVDGNTIGLFDIPASKLRRVGPRFAGASVVRED